MLTPVQKKKKLNASGGRFAIVASLYNGRYVDAMLHAAEKTLSAAGAVEVKVIRVPGAYEIPVVAAELCGGGAEYDAVICLGVILRGETTHAQHIGEAVTFGLTQVQVQTRVPVIHEVLLLENEGQAKVRCLGKQHNRGTEAAQTALQMAQLFKELRGSDCPF